MQNTISTLITFTLFKMFPEGISSQGFTRGFDSLHTFYGLEVHGYHHFRTKEMLTGKVTASLEELEAVMVTLFVLCFFAFKFACLDFFFLLLPWATL